MIEINTSEFGGDRNMLANILRDKFKVSVALSRNVIRIEGTKQSETQLGLQDAKDLVKRALHHMGLQEYRVIAQAGLITIRERKQRELHARRKGTVPSPRQSVPYFFPG